MSGACYGVVMGGVGPYASLWRREGDDGMVCVSCLCLGPCLSRACLSVTYLCPPFTCRPAWWIVSLHALVTCQSSCLSPGHGVWSIQPAEVSGSLFVTLSDWRGLVDCMPSRLSCACPSACTYYAQHT